MFKIFKENTITIQKFKPFFVTTDGVRHEGLDYPWYIADRLQCTVPEYIMLDIKSNGYIEDKNKVMYLLSNVVSIEWVLLKERRKIDKFSNYQISIATEEI